MKKELEMYDKICIWLYENGMKYFAYLIIGVCAILLFLWIGISVYQYLNPPQEITTMPQTQAETPKGVMSAADNAHIKIDDGQAKEVSNIIKEIHTTETVPVYIVQTDGKNVVAETEKAVKDNKADFAILTSKDNDTEKVDLSSIPDDTKVELNQYNIKAYKSQLNTIGYMPHEQVVEYVHQWKVSNNGNYIGAGIAHDLDDNKTYLKVTYTW